MTASHGVCRRLDRFGQLSFQNIFKTHKFYLLRFCLFCLFWADKLSCQCLSHWHTVHGEAHAADAATIATTWSEKKGDRWKLKILERRHHKFEFCFLFFLCFGFLGLCWIFCLIPMTCGPPWSHSGRLTNWPKRIARDLKSHAKAWTLLSLRPTSPPVAHSVVFQAQKAPTSL